MKRTFAFILALVMIFAMTACGAKEKEHEIDPDVFFRGMEPVESIDAQQGEDPEKTMVEDDIEQPYIPTDAPIEFDSADYTYTGMCGDNVQWGFNAYTGELVIAGEGSMMNYDRKDKVTKAPWGEYAEQILTARIGGGITNVGSNAFTGCYNMTSVDIPDSVTMIGNFAFYYCLKLAQAEIPESVDSIGERAFNNCESLPIIRLSKRVSFIGVGAFLSDVLQAIEVDEENASYCSVDGVLFTKDMNHLLRYPPAKTEQTYEIPDTVTAIAQYAFSDADYLTSMEISNAVTVISSNAFVGCDGLTHVEIGDGVTSLGWYAFWYCNGLESVTIGDGISVIGDDCFSNCTALNEVIFGDNVEEIGGGAFDSCTALQSVELPNSLRIIDHRAFDGCKMLTDVYMGENIEQIRDWAFGETNLTNIYYAGTQEQWDGIDIDTNDEIQYANIHFSE